MTLESDFFEMLVYLRTKRNETLVIEVSEDVTVLQLREILSDKHNFPIENTKLQFRASILKDDRLIRDLGNNEANPIAIYVSTPRQPSSPVLPKKQVFPLIPEAPKTPPPTPFSWDFPPPQPLLTPISDPLDPESLTMLLSMGFPKEKCVAALTLSNGNVARATELILRNILTPEKFKEYFRENMRDIGGRELSMSQIDQTTIVRQLIRFPQFINEVQRSRPVLVSINGRVLIVYVELAMLQQAYQFGPIESSITVYQNSANETPVFMFNDQYDESSPNEVPHATADFVTYSGIQNTGLQHINPPPPGLQHANIQVPELQPNSQPQNGQNDSEFQRLLATLSPSELDDVSELLGRGYDPFMTIQVFIACDKNQVAALACLTQIK